MFLIDQLPARIYIGIRGEENVAQVQFDVSAWDTLYPEGTYHITYTLPGSDVVYPEVPSHVIHAAGVLTWLPTDAITDLKDYGTMVIHCLEGDVEKRSSLIQYYVSNSHPASGEAPTSVADWITEANTKIGEMDAQLVEADAAESLREIAESHRNASELLREGAETDRETAEGLREGAENNREIAEGQRGSAETAREEAEALRVAAEAARMGFVPKGPYIPTNENKYGEWYTHDGGSYGYIYPTPSVGVSLSSKSHWQQIASQGLKGDPQTALELALEDAGNHFPTKNVEAALQSVGGKKLDDEMLAAIGTVAESFHMGVNVNCEIFAPRAAIFLRFDDGPGTDATVYTELLERNLVGGFAVVENLIGTGTYLTLAQIMGMQINGMEIMHHSKTHPTVASLSAANALGLSGFLEETAYSAARLRAMGLNVQMFIQPGTMSGADNPMHINNDEKLLSKYGDVLKRGYRAMQGYIYTNGSAIAGMPNSRPWGHASAYTIESNTLVQLQAAIDTIIKYGGVGGFNSHSFNFGTAGKLSWADFYAFLDYIKTKRDAGLLDVLTPTGACFCRRGNYLEQTIDPTFETFTTASSGRWMLNGGATIETSGGHGGNNFAQIPYGGGAGSIQIHMAVNGYRTIELSFWAKAPSTTGAFFIHTTDVSSPRGYQLNTWGGVSKIDEIPVAAGTGYTVGDLLALNGGGVAKVVKIAAGGAVTKLVLWNSGSFASTGVKTTTGGAGSGCTINVSEVFSDSLQGKNLSLSAEWTKFVFTFGLHDTAIASLTIGAKSFGDGIVCVDDVNIRLI